MNVYIEPYDDNILSIEFGRECFETYPCGHKCNVTYKDNTVKYYSSGYDIAKYLYNSIPDSNVWKSHFKKYLLFDEETKQYYLKELFKY